MAALRASRLVCSATLWMVVTMFSMSLVWWVSWEIRPTAVLTIDRVLADRATDWSRESMPRVEICAVSSAVENDSSAARRTSSLRLTCSVTSMANLMTLIIRPEPSLTGL